MKGDAMKETLKPGIEHEFKFRVPDINGGEIVRRVAVEKCKS